VADAFEAQRIETQKTFEILTPKRRGPIAPVNYNRPRDEKQRHFYPEARYKFVTYNN